MVLVNGTGPELSDWNLDSYQYMMERSSRTPRAKHAEPRLHPSQLIATIRSTRLLKRACRWR